MENGTSPELSLPPEVLDAPAEPRIPRFDGSDRVPMTVWLQTVEEHIERALAAYDYTTSLTDRMDEALNYLLYLSEQNAIDARQCYDIYCAYQQKHGGG